MTKLNTLDAARGEPTGYKVDMSRGERIGRVSSEWFSRPADERYLSLSELFAAVRGRAERSRTRTAESAAIRIEANRDDAERLALMLSGEDVPLVPTHWSFGRLASLVGAPATYLRQLPAPLAGINLQYRLNSHRAELVKTLEVEDGRARSPALIMAAYTTMNWLRRCSGSLATAPAIRAGRSPACSTGRGVSTIPRSTSPETRPRCTPRTATSFCSWLTTSIRSRRGGCRTAHPTSTSAVLLLELRGRRENAWDPELLSAGRLPEPQSLGR